MNYFWAFVVGGGICVIGQLLIDLTGLTPARILTGYVVAGVILSAVGWYAPLAEFAGCCASVLCGHILPRLEKGTQKRVLFIATGALMSQTTFLQKESIPAIAHLVELRSPQQKEENG